MTAKFRQASRALGSGDFSKARRLATALSESHPDSADVFSLLSAIDTAVMDFRGALTHIETAERIEPLNAAILAHKAHALAMLRDFSGALEVADKSASVGRGQGDVMATLGSVYTKCGEYEKSQRCFQAAVEIDPDDPVHNYNLGTALRFGGDFDGAERYFNQSIALRPEDYETYFARSGLRTQTDENNHVVQLESLLGEGIDDWHDEMFVCYALAKELEDLEDWDRSFEYLQRGGEPQAFKYAL